MTTATTQFTFTRTVDMDGPSYRVYDTTTRAYVTLAYRTGHNGRVWRATGTRGAYRTRRAAACAALAQRDNANWQPLDAHEEQWAADAPAIADPQ